MKSISFLIVLKVIGISCYLGSFELDGNAVTDSIVDWQTVDTYSQTFASTFVADVEGKTIFSGSKDINVLSAWTWTNGNVPDKDEITNAYAALINEGLNRTILYFGVDRFSNGGDAAMGFWFFQDNNVNPTAGGHFNGQHINGDLLIIAEFTNGGSTVLIQAYEWDSSVPNNLRSTSVNGILCSSQTLQDACGISNSVVSPSPWPYVPKANIGSPGSFPVFTFMEGGINLNKLYSSSIPCFSFFLAETRSSQELTATLKDWDSGSFYTCGLDIAVNCTEGRILDGVKYEYRFTTTVTNTGFSPLYDIFVQGTYSNHTIPSLQSGQSSSFQDTFVTTKNQDSTKNVTATIYFINSDALTDTDSSKCPPIIIHPLLILAKECHVNLVPQGGYKKIVVDYAINASNSGDVKFDHVLINENSEGVATNFNCDDLGIGESCTRQGQYYPSSPTDNRFYDVVSARGHSLLENITIATQNVTANCDGIVIHPAVNITRNCSVYLEQNGGIIGVKLCIQITVRNTGDVDLLHLNVTDTQIPSSSFDLQVGQSNSWIGCFFPSSLPPYSGISSVVGDPIILGFPSVYSQSLISGCDLCH